MEEKKRTNLTKDESIKLVEKGSTVKNRDEQIKTIDSFSSKLPNLEVSFGILTDLKDTCTMCKEAITGKYKGVRPVTICAVIGSFIYLVSPFNIATDVAVPVIGSLDDAAIISFVLRMVRHDLYNWRKYKADANTHVSLDDYLQRIPENQREAEVERLSALCPDDSIKDNRLRAENSLALLGI